MKMKALQLLGILAVAGIANTYYVSPTGNDSNAGTSAAPFKTVSKAVTILQTLRATNTNVLMKDTISLMAGTHTAYNIPTAIKTELHLISHGGNRSSTILNGGGQKVFVLDSTIAGTYPMYISKISITNVMGLIDGTSSTKPLKQLNLSKCRIFKLANSAKLFTGISAVNIDTSLIDSISYANLSHGVNGISFKGDTIQNNSILTIGISNTTTTIDHSLIRSNSFNTEGGVLNSGTTKVFASVFENNIGSLFGGTTISQFAANRITGPSTVLFAGTTSIKTPILFDTLNVQALYYSNAVAIDTLNFKNSLLKVTDFSKTKRASFAKLSLLYSTMVLGGKDTLTVNNVTGTNSIIRGFGNLSKMPATKPFNFTFSNVESPLDSLSTTWSQSYVNVDPAFTDSTAGTYILRKYSPCRDVFGTTNDMGYAVNTFALSGNGTDTTTFSTNANLVLQKAITTTLAEGEIIQDTIILRNSSSTDPIWFPGSDSVLIGSTGTFSSYSISHAAKSWIAPNSELRIPFSYTGKLNEDSVKVVCKFREYDGVNSYNTPDTITCIFSSSGKNAATILSDTWNEKTFHLGTSAVVRLPITNTGNHAITLSGITATGAYASKVSSIAFKNGSSTTIPAGASDTIVFTFNANQTGKQNIAFDFITPQFANNHVQSSTVTFDVIDPLLTLSPVGTMLNLGGISMGSSTTDSSRAVTNSTNYPILIDSVTFGTSTFSLLNSFTNVQIASGATEPLRIKAAPISAGTITDTCTIWYMGKTCKLPVTVQGVTSNFIPDSSEVGFGRIPLLGSRMDSVVLTNQGNSSVTITSMFTSDGAFTVVTPATPVTVPAQGTATVKIRCQAVYAQGGTHAGELEIQYSDITGTKTPIKIQLNGSTVGMPTASIDSISPSTATWDSSAAIHFYSTATDADIAGPTDVKYYWFAGTTLLDSTEDPAVKISNLGIGVHSITLKVKDNEGDTILTSAKTVTINGLSPYAKIDSIVPGSVIIRDGANIKLNLTAYDMDQNATSAKDGLKSVQWYSTVAGVLTGVKSKIATFDPSSLELGLHGFYAMVTDSEGQISYSDTAFIPVQNSMGHALIVTGAVFGDNSYFMNNISPNANIAYKRLRDRGFSDAQIRYMNPVSWQSIDGDGLTDSKIVDTTKITKAAVHAYLQSIAADMKKDIPLVIYFLGHGNASKQNAKFYLNDSEYVDPATLNTWLTEFGDLSANKSYITVILDFCYSGGFQTGLKSATQKRAIITSASTGTTAYFARGKSFGTAIFNEMYRGKSLNSCFETAKLWSDQNAPGGAKATPTINVNGNATNSETADLTLADGIYIGGSQQLQGLIAEIDSVESSVQNNSVDLSVSVIGDVNAIRCRIIPADFDPSKGTYGTLPTIELIMDSKTKQFNGTVSGLKNGKYLLMVEGEDAGSNAILPQGVAVEIGGTGIIVTSAPKQLFFGTAMIGGSTVLKFGLPESAPVTINIYDLRGRLVNQLVNGVLNAGFYSIPLDNLNAAGCYITRFVAGSKTFTEKVMIQR